MSLSVAENFKLLVTTHVCVVYAGKTCTQPHIAELYISESIILVCDEKKKKHFCVISISGHAAYIAKKL